MASFLMKLSCVLGLLGLASCVSRMPGPLGMSENHARRELEERLRNSREPSVLFIGNSYSFGVPKAFKSLAAERGKKVRVGHSTYGGWTLERHASHEATLRKIRSGRWDVVVIQEQSKLPAMAGKRAVKMFPAVRLLASEARRSGAIPVLYQTWGRRDGDSALRGDTFFEMNHRLRKGYRAAANSAGGLVVVPVGDSWEKEMRTGRGRALFTEDGSHPSAAGNQVTATVFYQSFFPS